MTHGPYDTPKPIPLVVRSENIPADLVALKQWLIWKYFYKMDLGYWDKPPLSASQSGNAGSSTDPKTWATFDKTLSIYQLGNFDGIGLALTEQNGITGFDLDDCVDPETGDIAEWALAIIRRVQTYWERSPSGTGLRGFGYGRKPGGRCRTGDFEMYSHGRYLCITGHHLEGTPQTLESVQEAIDTIYAEMFPTQARQHSSNGNSPHADDAAIIEALRCFKNGAKFCRLFDDGDISDYGGDHSVADQGLCRLIAFRTQNPDQIDRLFRLSALNRHKWESRQDYRDRTIARAILHVRDRYQGVSAEHNGQPSEQYNTTEERDEPPPDEVPAEEIPIHLTDRGNALRLVRIDGKNLHYIYRWKKWLVWDETRWVVDEGNLVEAMAKQVITRLYQEAQRSIDRIAKQAETGREGGEASQKQRAKEIEIATATLKWALKSESAERLAGMLKHARSERGIAITPEQLDANPWILNCLNGTIDLKTGTKYPHRREDLCTKRIEIAFDPQATCPNWNKFLWRIMGGPKPDEEGHETTLAERHERATRLIKYLQDSVGYSLTGVIREQILQFMHGTGDNGKSTFSETLAALMGEYFQKAPQELLMRKARQQSNGPSPEIARLCGVRLVIASEIDEKHRLNEAQVKDLTGNDRLTARGLYEDYFEFNPTHKIWMYGNHKPVIVGTDDAIWKRPKLIPFTEKIPKDEQVTDLREKYLLPELPGILAWAVRGCLEWQRHGLQVPPEVQAETKKYRNEMDLVSGFIDDRCETGPRFQVRGSELHRAYLQYIEGDKDAHLSARKFYDRLRERGFGSHVGTANKTYLIGLKLKPNLAADDDAEPESFEES